MWQSEGYLWESILFLHQVVSGDRTQVVSLDGKCLYLLNHLSESFLFGSVKFQVLDRVL